MVAVQKTATYITGFFKRFLFASCCVLNSENHLPSINIRNSFTEQKYREHFVPQYSYVPELPIQCAVLVIKNCMPFIASSIR